MFLYKGNEKTNMKKIVLTLLLITTIQISTLDKTFQATKAQQSSDGMLKHLLNSIPSSKHHEFLQKSKEYAKENKNEFENIFISEENYKNAWADITLGEKIYNKNSSKTDRHTALHEAGHAFVIIALQDNVSIDYIEIQDRLSTAGACIYSRTRKSCLSDEDYIKKDISVGFAGGVMEQIMHIPQSVKFTTEKDGLEDFYSRTWAKSDQSSINHNAYSLMEIQQIIGVSLFFGSAIAVNSNRSSIAQVVAICTSYFLCSLPNKELEDKIKQESYEETVKLLTENKDKVIQIAQILEKKKSISKTEEIEELYALCGKKRPLYPWEKE